MSDVSSPVEGDGLRLTVSQQHRLHSVIYKTLERLGADYQVLSVFGSLFDTLSVDEVLEIAEGWLATGETLWTPQ